MAEFLDLLAYPFMVRAMVGGALSGGLCALLGNFVLLRQMAFFADALSHIALPGVAIAFLLNLPPTPVLLLFCLVAGLGMTAISNKSALPIDTIIGVFFAAGLALGIVLLSRVDGYSGRILQFLFGDILALSWWNVQALALLAVLVTLFLVITLRQQLLLTFNAELAQQAQMPVTWLNSLFSILLSLTVGLSIQLVGALLVSAFVVIPAATARNLSHTFTQVFWRSPLIGASSAVIGIAAAGWSNTPAGPTIVAVQVILFCLSLGLLGLRRRLA